MIKTRQVDYKDLDEISYHYKNVFGRAITIDQYLKTFLDNKTFHSQIAINDKNDIIGHIGISQHPIKGLKEKKIDLVHLSMKNIEELEFTKIS